MADLHPLLNLQRSDLDSLALPKLNATAVPQNPRHSNQDKAAEAELSRLGPQVVALLTSARTNAEFNSQFGAYKIGSDPALVDIDGALGNQMQNFEYTVYVLPDLDETGHARFKVTSECVNPQYLGKCDRFAKNCWNVTYSERYQRWISAPDLTTGSASTANEAGVGDQVAKMLVEKLTKFLKKHSKK